MKNLTLGWSGGFGIQLFHDDDWFTTYHYYYYNLLYGVKVIAAGDPNSTIVGVSRGSGGSFTTNNFSVRVGKKYYFDNRNWQHNWLAGINLEHAREIRSLNFDLGPDPLVELVDSEPEVNVGIYPAIQGGYQLTFSDGVMRVSLLTVGNLGFIYHSRQDFFARSREEHYTGLIEGKGDAISIFLQLGFDFGNKN